VATTHNDPSAQLRASEPRGALLPSVAPEEGVIDTGGDPTVLVVDDEQPIRTLLACVLEPMGYAVLGACDGHEALGVLREPSQRIDLVLLDVQLPECDGASVLRAIRRLRPGVPVVVQTGHVAEDLGAKLGGMSVEAVLEKPFHARNVIQLLEQLCGRPAASLD
jgi:two-component system, cell cycle sensor histidine kinase and response regulator CckA